MDPSISKPDRIVSAVFCMCMVVAAIGCGGGNGNGKTAHLSGGISVRGKALPDDAEGYVQFMPDAGGQAAPTSVTIEDGKYDAPEVPKGSVTAIFNITRLTGRMVREDNFPGATPYPERENLVPAKHQAGVKIQVEGDNDAHNFDL